jgi:hypothetical protein
MDSGFNDEFSVSPQDVLGQSKQEGYYYPERAMMAKQMGMNPLSEAAPLFQSKKRGGGQSMGMGGGGGGSQKAPEEPSRFAKDAEFYANAVEDFGAAAALTGSKNGRAVFQMYDPYEFDMGLPENGDKNAAPTKATWRIIPKGSRQVATPQGMKDLPVHAYANQYGVTNVPFKGGDEAADSFRGLVVDSQMLLGNLSRLEKIYSENAMLTGFGYSEASTEARALETSITKDFMKVMTGSKGLGGNVSDKDISFAQSMTPQRASSWFTRFKGNERTLLKRVRSMTMEKLKNTANANGVDFLAEDNEGNRTTQNSIWDNNSITFD